MVRTRQTFAKQKTFPRFVPTERKAEAQSNYAGAAANSQLLASRVSPAKVPEDTSAPLRIPRSRRRRLPERQAPSRPRPHAPDKPANQAGEKSLRAPPSDGQCT